MNQIQKILINKYRIIKHKKDFKNNIFRNLRIQVRKDKLNKKYTRDY